LTPGRTRTKTLQWTTKRQTRYSLRSSAGQCPRRTRTRSRS
jgi:hypothetical protein